ncbi:MAG: hypothetical protein M0R06_26065 [Sphaerochaeta sp.]|nr:hypothetical protein [Sphaerochaeta sp.]
MDDASCSALTLNAHQTMPSADMQVETDVTLPASPFYNSQFNLYYRITGTLESADQFWRARLVRSAANTTWDMTLYLINGATETSKLSIADVGTADGLRVICIGDEHRVYTRESAVWTQRGAPITDATYNDQKGVNTVYTPDVTLTALRGSQPSPF